MSNLKLRDASTEGLRILAEDFAISSDASFGDIVRILLCPITRMRLLYDLNGIQMSTDNSSNSPIYYNARIFNTHMRLTDFAHARNYVHVLSKEENLFYARACATRLKEHFFLYTGSQAQRVVLVEMLTDSTKAVWRAAMEDDRFREAHNAHMEKALEDVRVRLEAKFSPHKHRLK